ncbi:MAG: cell division protein FtsA [Candidatus Andersenbacteria bacterium]
MAKAQHITGIDIGSTTTRVIIGQHDHETGHLSIVGLGEAPTLGVQKGVISDVDEAVSSLTRALDAAERMAGAPVEHAYVSINGSHIESQNSRGVIAVSRADGEITPDDVDRVVNAAQAISLPANREILHVLPQNYVVDGQEHIHDPVGMTGVRLEVEAHVIEGSAPFIKNLTKVVNQAGVHIEDFVFAPLAAATAVLDKRQKELGVVLVDLGGGTTSLAIFEEKMLLHTAVLPVGASHITNDIAIGLRTSIDVAEALKMEHGTALPEEVKANEDITIEAEGNEQESVSRKEVANIISARLEELFSFIDKELKNIGRSGLLPAGVVLTGAGAHMPGIIEVAKKRLRLPVRIGIPHKEVVGVVGNVQDSSYATGVGMLLWAEEQDRSSSPRAKLSVPNIGNSVQKVRDWMKTFLP